MSKVVSLTGLTTLVKQIQAEHLAVREAARLGIEHAMRAGDLLIKAKPQVPHGQWLPWLEECGFGDRTAQLYMRFARNRAELESKLDKSKYATIADLSLGEADKLLRDSQAKRYFKTEERIVARATAAITAPTKTTTPDASAAVVVPIKAPAPTPAPLAISCAAPATEPADPTEPEPSLRWETIMVPQYRLFSGDRHLYTVFDNGAYGGDKGEDWAIKDIEADGLEDVWFYEYETAAEAKKIAEEWAEADLNPDPAEDIEEEPETSPVEPAGASPAPLSLDPAHNPPTQDSTYWRAPFGTVQGRKVAAIERAHDLGADDLLKKLKTRCLASDLDAIEAELARREADPEPERSPTEEESMEPTNDAPKTKTMPERRIAVLARAAAIGNPDAYTEANLRYVKAIEAAEKRLDEREAEAQDNG